jgi:hypothetical protein
MTWWSLLLSLAAALSPPDRPNRSDNPVRVLKLARGWVTAQLVRENMSYTSFKLLTTGMRPDVELWTTWGGSISYRDYGLWITTGSFSGTPWRAWFAVPR